MAALSDEIDSVKFVHTYGVGLHSAELDPDVHDPRWQRRQVDEFVDFAFDDDHRLERSSSPVLKLVDGEIMLVDEPALTALNMRLRDDYTRDCAKGIERFNKIIERIGVDFRLALPHVAFHRDIGEFKDVQATPSGVLIDAATWAKQKDQWLPSLADGEFIASLMKPVSEPGQFASWIAPPRVGIDNRPGDFEYVKIEAA